MSKDKKSYSSKIFGYINQLYKNFINRTKPVIGEDFPVRYVAFRHRMWAMMIDCIIPLPFVYYIFSMSYQEQQEMPNVEQAFEDARNGVIEISDAWWILFDTLLETGQITSFSINSLTSFLILGAVIIFFWQKWGATPGKWLLSITILDEETLQKPKIMQYIFRYLGYFISAICFGLGFVWVVFDKCHRSWHDHISGTIVVYTKPEDPHAAEKRFRRQTYMAIAIFVLFVILLLTK